VEKKIDSNGGALAFVDDYTAWVTGPSAEANIEGIQRIISKATAWERRSGATFEGEKTVMIHFTRNGARTAAGEWFFCRYSMVLSRISAILLVEGCLDLMMSLSDSLYLYKPESAGLTVTRFVVKRDVKWVIPEFSGVSRAACARSKEHCRRRFISTTPYQI